MSWNLPISVEIDGTEYPIRNKCDYRVVLDVIKALNDEDLDMQYRIQCALFIFYGNDELNTQEKVLHLGLLHWLFPWPGTLLSWMFT